MKYITLDGLNTFAAGLATKISDKFAKKTDIPTKLPANGGDAATNTTYSAMKGATASAAGTQGLVPASAAGGQEKYLKGDGTWGTIEAGTVVEEASMTDIDNIIEGLFS